MKAVEEEVGGGEQVKGNEEEVMVVVVGQSCLIWASEDELFLPCMECFLS